MKRIILDTNILLAPCDVFTLLQESCDFSYEACVVQASIDELEELGKKQGKDGVQARIALGILKKNKVTVLPDTGYVDDILVAYSTQGVMVATQDQALKKRLTKPYIILRQQRRFVVVW